MLESLNTDNWNQVILRFADFLRETREPTRSRREDGQGKCLGGIYEHYGHTFDIYPRFGKSYNVVGFLVKLDGEDIPADPNLHPRRFAYFTSVKRARIAIFRKLYDL